jgi:hypothetical protein
MHFCQQEAWDLWAETSLLSKKSGFKSGTVEEGSGAYRREWHERHTLVVNRVAYRKGEAERKELFHERNGSKLLAADPWW